MANLERTLYGANLIYIVDSLKLSGVHVVRKVLFVASSIRAVVKRVSVRGSIGFKCPMMMQSRGVRIHTV